MVGRWSTPSPLDDTIDPPIPLVEPGVVRLEVALPCALAAQWLALGPSQRVVVGVVEQGSSDAGQPHAHWARTSPVVPEHDMKAIMDAARERWDLG